MTHRECYEYPLRHWPNLWMAQVVLPLDLTKEEAERLCAFIMTLPQPLSSAAKVKE